MCYHRARKLNDCKSQTAYDAYKVDKVITEIVEKIFQNIIETDAIGIKLESELAADPFTAYCLH